jgi:hypothetical protein
MYLVEKEAKLSTREDELVKSEQARSGLGSDCEGLSFIVMSDVRTIVRVR